ncbi:12668_t:CDS:2, partial [Dentiscutata erythropus]
TNDLPTLYFKSDEKVIKEDWVNIILNINGYRTFLGIKRKYKTNRENRWSKMVLDNMEMIKPKSEQKYLTEFIKQLKQILQNPEQFEICNIKLDSINNQYYLIVDNNNPYSPEPLNLHVTKWIKTHINDTEYAQLEDEL